MTLKKIKKMGTKGLVGKSLNNIQLIALKQEIINFTKRNSITELQNNQSVICERCLKAHVISKAEELAVDKEAISKILKIKEEAGHYGYYLDNKSLIKI